MKTIPPACPEPEFGRKYWRSLDNLAETPEFREWVEREFPAGASEWTDPTSRRHFVKIMSASFLLAGLGFAGSGCRRPEKKILPFTKMPEGYVHGVPQYFATAMPNRGSAIPLVAKSNDGRPTKVEGNSLLPDSNGGTDRFAQASILNLYDPDRAKNFARADGITSQAAAFDFLGGLSKSAQANQGQGLAFLLDENNSPSRLRLQEAITAKFPQARWFVHEPVDLDIQRRAASAAFGKSVKPQYLYDAAKVIVSLDCDFIGSEADVLNNIRRFTSGRRMDKPEDTPNRLYSIESFFTLTGFNADHRLRIPASAVIQAAATLAAALVKGGVPGLEKIGSPASADPRWLSECANDLAQHPGECLIVAGYRQPMAVHLLAHAMNVALGNVGKTVVFHEVPETKAAGLPELAQLLNNKQVQTLVILGGNPGYTAPADLDWPATQRKAATVVRLGYYEDETSVHCDWLLPAAHYLESWGDARTGDGTVVPIQPLIAPLFGGITQTEVLARILGSGPTGGYDIARETFAGLTGGGNYEEAWKRFLHDGFRKDSAFKPVSVTLNGSAVAQAVAAAKVGPAGKGNLEVVFAFDYSLGDGSYNNNGWLQELPDPITKIVWDNAVLISRKTAEELGVENMQVVELKVGDRSIRGPIWVQPGFADYSLGLLLGYGREKSGRVGTHVGFNVYPLRTTGAENFAVGAALNKTGATYTLACTQDHWSLEGRPIVREAYLEEFRKHPNFAKKMEAEEHEGLKPLYPNPFDKKKALGLHQWGMSIDLNTCVGCSACMMACQSENNVPIVGKDQVRRGREMHWLRLDRYYAGVPSKIKPFAVYKTEEKQQFEEWIDDPQVVTQPMMCQHCESAPCENVCPVNATVHDNEGLNLMVYNRCVGTRYCSNNCPYKVRKFNYFDYNKRGIGKDLYLGPLHTRPEDEWDLLKMSKNPEVTVRMRGVMEKCTFCIQRVESAKITQKVKAGASPNVIVPDGTFTTACAQACPAGAIVFGNLNDSESRVSKLKKQERDYTALDFLLTKPRLTYLARVRNPNPKMPDYREWPHTFEEYKDKMGDPFKQSEGGGESHEPAAEKGAI